MATKLSEEEKQKIEEEEKVRAEARAKYETPVTTPVPVKKKKSKLAIGCLTIGIIYIVIAVGYVTSKMPNYGPATQVKSGATNVPLSADQQKLYDQVTISSSTIKKDVIGTPEWHVTVHNGTDKTIDAVTVDAHFKNNFDEPVGEWNAKKNEVYRAGIQDTIKPGADHAGLFNLAVYDSATKVQDEKISRIHFTDGQTIEIK